MTTINLSYSSPSDKGGRCTGFVLYEVLISSVLASMILTGLALALSESIRSYGSIRLHHEETYQAMKVAEMAQKIVQDLDCHPLSLTPRIHTEGNITFADGTPAHLSSTAALLPSHQSDAVTYFRTSALYALSVYDQRIEGGSYTLSTCLRYSPPAAPESSFKTFLAVSTRGFIEMVSDQQRKLPSPSGDQPRCTTFFLKPVTKSMIAPGLLLPSDSIVQLMPVQSIYSIYLDRTSHLRFVSHQGSDVLENQPILDNAPPLFLKGALEPRTQLFTLSVTFSKQIQRNLLNHTPRLSLTQFLTMRP